MEQKENPANVAASEPDKENPYADLITIVAHKSILEPLKALGGAVGNVNGNLYDFGMMRCATGTYLSMYFSGDDNVVNPFATNRNAVPQTASLPYTVVLELLRNICMIQRVPMFAEVTHDFLAYQKMHRISTESVQ